MSKPVIDSLSAAAAPVDSAPANSSKMISVEDAQSILLQNISLLPTEMAPLLECKGRILAKDAKSDIDISPFDNSAMDGFAVRFSDFEQLQTEASSKVQRSISHIEMPIVGRIGAGSTWNKTLESGQALRIMTGAPMPPGADSIVKIEDAQVLGASDACPEGQSVRFTKAPLLGDHVRPKGEEASKGDVILQAGELISPAGIGLLAACGHARAEVFARPRVVIIATGDELVDIDTLPLPGQIRNSNSYSLAAQIQDLGGVPIIMQQAQDSLEGLAVAIKTAIGEHAANFVITSGGAGGGDFDFAARVVQNIGRLFFTKVNMKPGKAQIFGLVEGVPVFGLSGNPGAASVGLEIIVRPALLKMQGHKNLMRATTVAVSDEDIHKHDERRRLYLRARLYEASGRGGDVGGGEGAGSNGSAGNSTTATGGIKTGTQMHVISDAAQSSALLGALNRSNCLLVVPEGDGSVKAGELVKCIRLDVLEGTV